MQEAHFAILCTFKCDIRLCPPTPFPWSQLNFIQMWTPGACLLLFLPSSLMPLGLPLCHWGLRYFFKSWSKRGSMTGVSAVTKEGKALESTWARALPPFQCRALTANGLSQATPTCSMISESLGKGDAHMCAHMGTYICMHKQAPIHCCYTYIHEHVWAHQCMQNSYALHADAYVCTCHIDNMCAHTYTHTYVLISMCIDWHTCTYVYRYAQITCLFTHKHTCKHTQTHSHIYWPTCTQMNMNNHPFCGQVSTPLRTCVGKFIFLFSVVLEGNSS